MHRCVLLAAIAFVMSSALTSPTSAYETWCADDPVIVVGGRLVDIQVQMPLSHVATMRSTTLTVIIPRNVPGAVLIDDVSAFPMTTKVAPGPYWNGEGPLPITVVTQVSAEESYPIRVVATPLLSLGAPLAAPTTASDVANTTLRMPVSLGQ